MAGSITALITGASGFLGTSLRHALERSGSLIIAVPSGPHDHPPSIRCENLYQALVATFRSRHVDVVFHLAGAGTPYVDGLGPHYQHGANVLSTEAVTRAIEATGFRGRVVFSSSASVYGNSGIRRVIEDDPLRPCTEYGHAKAQAEACLVKRLSQRCELRIARIFHVFGPGQRKLAVFDLASRVLSGERPLGVRGTGEEMRDFIFIEDAVRALIFLGVERAKGAAPQIVNVCSGVPTRIGDLVRLLLHLADRSEHEIQFRPEEAANPVVACVGDPGRLARLGLTLPCASAPHFEATLSWIRSDTIPTTQRPSPAQVGMTVGDS